MAGAAVVKSNVLERKVGHDGRVREFECTWEHRAAGVAIIRYDIVRGGLLADGAVTIPPGSRSYGYFWKSRRYGCYRFIGPGDSGLIAHRFDALKQPSWTANTLEYHDLILDWWVTKDEVLLEEDRDELDAAIEAGLVSPSDVRIVTGAAQDISSRYRHIVDEISELERKHVNLSE